MLDTPITAERVEIDGHPHWKYPPSGRHPEGLILPVIMGGSPEGDPPKDPPAGDPPAADPPKEPPAADPPADPQADSPKDEPLGKGGEAALAAEREARKQAEKDAKAARAALKKHEDANLSETERLKKEAEEGKAASEAATAKLRKASLLAELAKPEHGIADARAATELAMAGKTFEFDDDDDPKDVAASVKKLLDAYPVLKGKRGPAPRTDPGGGGGGGGEQPQLTADELAYAKSFGMTPEEYAKYKATPGPVPVEKPAKKEPAAA